MPNALRIGLLGPLQVRDETGRQVHVGGRQVRVLLTLLALNAGRVVPAGSLAGELWPDDPPGNPGNALQTLVSRLRAELRQAGAGDVIESHPAGYRLAVPPDAVDVAVFEALAIRGRHALADGDAAQAARVLREALLAWRGQPLADVAGSDFADVAAARLTELRSSVLADRIEADLALGEGATLVGELRVLLSADPLAERPRALLMRALYAAGRQAEAIAVYHEGRELLADQLGVDPSARLEQAYLTILRGGEQPAAVGPAADRPHAPPEDPERAAATAQAHRSASRAQTPLTSFVGRDEDVSRVMKSLRAARLVTLTGPGGVGKTRLAAEASARLDAAAWFVPLASVTDPAEVAYAVLGTLGIREPVIARRTGEAAAGPLDRLAAALADRDEVLILDNCEHVVDAAAALAAHVLAACPRVRILATSRQPLRIDGETLSPVSPLPVPPAPAAPVVVASYGSARLLRDRAVAVRPEFELGEANAADVARICRALDGMPLAIELAAVWLRTLTPAQLAERLDDRFALLTGGSRAALPRQRTLRAVVDWSWDLLSEPEQVLARRLAVFPGGATLAAAEQVCADELLRAGAVLPALDGLVDKSIVAAAENPDDPGEAERSGPRYRMLETVRAYGLERLAEAGERDRLQDAFAGYYLDLAETADSQLRGAGQRRWLPELAAEQDNLHTALRWTIARQDGDRVLRFVLALGWYWMLRGQPGEPEELARQALALKPRERSARMAEARIVCALTAAGPLFDIDAVRPDLAAAVADFADLSGGLMTHPLAAMGEPMMVMFDRKPDRAMAMFDRYAESDDPWTRAAVPLQRGSFDSVLGRLEKAEADCRASLAAFRELGDIWATAAALVQLAQFARHRGDYPTAITYLQEAVGLGRELRAWGDLAHIGGLVAAVQLRMGDLAAARAELEQAEREDSTRGGTMSDSAVLFGLVRAELHVAEGDSAAVVRQCEKVLSWLERKRTAWWQGFRAQVEARHALAVLTAGDRVRARALLADALRDAQDWVELPPLADVIDAIAVLALQPDGPGPECAAVLLGASHSIRGCFDESSLDAPAARDAARARLGADEFAAAYQRGRELAREDALALAASTVADHVTLLSPSSPPPV
jgi:predicted ATPase/DNA-binding SARP family transcriptional activator/tetratricopeptide (TPR) repeat protein